ncbi:MAG: type II toxin-antitoxin system RelE/ParE family toxin [Verrucomicrobiaceae bacterium]|jgi:plasmid stabilization system protein ParE|nr:type II toxin-antitoxin system RelE/ParE family toxin [Verrucomicrobiaceae bacterium]
MNEIVVLAGADTDMLRKFAELDEHSPEVADRFERDLHEALELISRHPQIGFGHLYPPYRKWSLRGWNMAIFYQPSGSRCFIHAVLDMRQAPEALQAILQARTHP